MQKDGQNATDVKMRLSSCLLANETICEIIDNQNFTIAVYNPLSINVTHYVRIPVNESNYELKDLDGNAIEFDIIPNYFKFVSQSTSKNDLVFAAEIPALGLKYYTAIVNTTTPVNVPPVVEDEFYFGNNVSGFSVNETGFLSAVKINGADLDVSQAFYFYSGAEGNNTAAQFRASGAYIFRPEADLQYLDVANATVSSFRGKIVDEFNQKFTDQIYQTIRVYKYESYVEFDWVVGPIDQK